MSERLGIEIDYCPQCRGVWLDRGELDKIIERSMRELAPTGPPPAVTPMAQPHQATQPYYDNRQGHHDDHYDKHQGYRKKSIWQEMFD
jgi:Zn-finger nucleic acid-binding protein